MHETALISSNYEFRMLQVQEPPLFTNQRHILFIVFYMNSITTKREFFSEFLVKQMRVGGIWEVASPLPGGRGLPPCCRAAWGAGRWAVGRPAPRDLGAIFSANFFYPKMPLPPRCWAARSRPGRPGYIPVNFQIKNIFL